MTERGWCERMVIVDATGDLGLRCSLRHPAPLDAVRAERGHAAELGALVL